MVSAHTVRRQLLCDVVQRYLRVGIHLIHLPDKGRFGWLDHQLLCAYPVHYIRLCPKAVGRFTAHFETPLAAGVPCVLHPLLYRFPFQLGEHDTDI